MNSAQLLALACIAFRERQFEDAGRLFAASQDADDSTDTLESLCCLVDVDLDFIEREVDTMITESNDFKSLSEIAEAISESMKDEYVAVGSSEDEVEDIQSESTEEDGERQDSENSGTVGSDSSESSEEQSTPEETVGEQSGSASSDSVQQRATTEGSSEANSSEIEAETEETVESTSSDIPVIKSCIGIRTE